MHSDEPSSGLPTSGPSASDFPASGPFASNISAADLDDPMDDLPDGPSGDFAGDHPGGAHVLVLPDRDAAEAVAERLAGLHPSLSEPELHREALSGEDDAEDAQWLVVLPLLLPEGVTPAVLDALAAGEEGWLEGFSGDE